ncbi:CpaF family protein [Catellatospora chokoriensis]|uniref:CpaF family protein n=1 Tax=Catellatospora chokoriensis TaxID=310353 RepID=UPI0027E59E28|nr:ATPase, T2SS/T4P/T4SS family [Catellatospora chokoriensis]
MTERDLLERLRASVADRMAAHAGGDRLDAAARRELAQRYIAEELDAHARQSLHDGQATLSPQLEAQLAAAVVDALTGAGLLQQLLDDPDVENIDANGCDHVWVRRTDGSKLMVGPIAESDEQMVELIRRIATEIAIGDGGQGEERGIDRNNPHLDLRLRGGYRLHAAVSVCARPSLSIRRPTLIATDLAELTARGMMDPGLAQVLHAAMVARLNIVIAGGTNVGKTTFARAAARAIPARERLITIEDVFELELYDPVAHPDVVAFQARRPNLEGVGAVTMSALVRAGLRMNPDRVIVGEVRGDEVIDLLKAMTQGNDGSFATVHASSSAQAFGRLAMYAVQAPERLALDASAMLISQAVHMVVHLGQTRDRARVVTSVREVTGCDGRDVISNEVWTPGPDGRAVPATPLRAATLDRLEAAGLSARTIDQVGW